MVRVVKDTDGNLNESLELANLWLCKGANCTVNGQGYLLVREWVLNVSGDPQGVGAFEFQVKYDNHIFDIQICEGSAPLNGDGTCATAVSNDPQHWLYSTGRIPGALGIGGCAATILTENDIRFGCVSKEDPSVNTLPGCLGPDNAANAPGIECGPKTDGIAATLYLTPKADLGNRITPGNDNGIIRTVLDEGCEVTDIWGHPLSRAATAYNPATQLPNDADGDGYDQLGREILLLGILPGGLVEDCADLTITVRILEGDMNVDCRVDITDDQTEASHYGAFFGSLLYQPWYDLEPALKDGDVDVKDLQKVFGRNGSTCASPVPPQDPLPDPDP